MDGVNFQDLSEAEYVQLIQDNVVSFQERLNFSAKDARLLRNCVLSLKAGLGGASAEFDEVELQRVGELDDAGERDTYQPRQPWCPPPISTEVPVPRSSTPRGSIAAEIPRAQSSAAASSSSRPATPESQAKSRPTRLPHREPSSERVPPPPPPPPPHPVKRPPRRTAPTAAPEVEVLGRRGVEASVSGRRDVKRPLEDLVSGNCPNCNKPREECFKAGDWACKKCGQHNYPDKEVCSNYKCNAERDVEVLSRPAPMTPPKAAGAPPAWCASCNKPRSVCFKPYDWNCPYCGNHNWARKQVLAAAFQCRVGVGLLVWLGFARTCVR